MSKIDTSNWGKFKASELFGKAKLGKYHNPNDLTPDEDGYEYICASNLNNGVNKDMPKVSGTGVTLTSPNIIAWGKQCPMFTWHKHPCVTSQGMYYIELGELSEQCALFIITCLENACKGMYGYNNCLIGSKFDEIEILLPAKSEDVPDWDYMQERIAELEQERIAELEQYLLATGLNDYTLTDEDLKTLALSGFRGDEAGNLSAVAGARKEMRGFRISDVFDLKKGQRLTKADQLPGDTPFIGSTESNNGVTGYIGQRPIFDGNAITVSYNGSVGQVFYQEQPFWASDDVNVLYLKDHMLDRRLFEYFGASLYRAGKAFSYTFKWNLARMRDTMFILPIQTDAVGRPVIDLAKTYHPDGFVPDWDYMAAYIRAIEKLVIKDVVDFKDVFISKAKGVVGT